MKARIITEQHGNRRYIYEEGKLVAIDAPIRSRHWCVEHDAPLARYNDAPFRQCVELVKRLERGSISDEPYDCQIVPNVSVTR